jgi:tRNA (guanine-N7-)-methyltransferase
MIPENMEKANLSFIRTFGRRHGKALSSHQQSLIDNLLPKLLPQRTDAVQILEIGFGAGEHLVTLAEQYPDKIIFGAEPFVNGIAKLLVKITDDKNEITPPYNNIRIWPDDVRKLISDFDLSGLDHIYILHPDPWPKARHEKRRLCSGDFLKTLAGLLSKNGQIIIGTDHKDYYDWIIKQAQYAGLFIKNPDIDIIKTRYQEKNLSGSDKTMYIALSGN